MTHIILYFGSFNPIHNGHTSVARYVLDSGLCDELWFVVSPANPFKENSTLAPDGDRLEMTRVAVAEKLPGGRAGVCDVEFGMPRPSYTIDTLRLLGERYPDTVFSLLMGADIIGSIGEWKDYERLMSDYRVYVYPRGGFPAADGRGMEYLNGAPQWDYSSTDVRAALEQGRDASGMVAAGVLRYINNNGLWVSGELKALDAAIEAHPSSSLYMERGKFHNRSGQFGKALNDFNRALEFDPDNAEARTYVTMLREMYNFRYLDYYNP